MVKKKNSMVGAVAVPVKRRGLWKTIWRYKWLYLMLVPVIAYYAIFKYAPMYGIVMAFQKYNVFKGVFGSEFIGLDVFKKYLQKQISGKRYEIQFLSILQLWRLIFHLPLLLR